MENAPLDPYVVNTQVLVLQRQLVIVGIKTI